MYNHQRFYVEILNTGTGVTTPAIYRQALEQADAGYVEVYITPKWLPAGKRGLVHVILSTVDPTYVPAGGTFSVTAEEVISVADHRLISEVACRVPTRKDPTIMNKAFEVESNKTICLRLNLPGSKRGLIQFWNWYPRITAQVMAAQSGGKWDGTIPLR